MQSIAEALQHTLPILKPILVILILPYLLVVVSIRVGAL
jgi:hypothetical protein